MITVIYFLLLAVASVEDYRSHRVSKYIEPAVWLLGLINIILTKENRWVTVSLTCLCFVVLYVCYLLVNRLSQKGNRELVFGGADVRLIPAMMLVQGWDTALLGIFLGLAAALLRYGAGRRKSREIPLVPWMSAGCFLIEIIYLFFGRSVL